MNNHRVDRVPKRNSKEEYKTPFGMNSLVLITSKPIYVREVRRKLPKLLDNEVYIYSVWNSSERVYNVVAIL